MSHEGDLAAVYQKVTSCRICLEAPIGTPLSHDPRPVLVPSVHARILIAGQAPGTKVHESGKPFTDASGDRLRDWMGVTRDEFYDPACFAILPMGFCFPGQDEKGGDLPPRRECAPAWRTVLMQQMPQIELLLAIGGYAQAWHLGKQRMASLTETVANWRDIFDAPRFPKMFPLPHPSWRNTGWMKRHPWFETDLLPVLRAEIRSRLSVHPENSMS